MSLRIAVNNVLLWLFPAPAWWYTEDLDLDQDVLDTSRERANVLCEIRAAGVLTPELEKKVEAVL